MLNSATRSSSTSRFKAMCSEGDNATLLNMSELTITEMVNAVEKKHEKLKGFFYSGEDMAQHYSWLEQNLVFDIAHQASKYGVIALTTHDSFRVPIEDKEVMEMVISGTGFDEIYKKNCLF